MYVSYQMPYFSHSLPLSLETGMIVCMYKGLFDTVVYFKIKKHCSKRATL